MFIMQLVAILVATGNRRVARRMAQWERSNTRLVKLVSGLSMVGVGLVILLWFV
jgi:cytochrome c biogenesis protein CcdA